MLSKLILDWYNEHKRVLPWRDIENPYFTWVSEIMLQQTQVNTVIPYFNRFITTLPTVKDLAECEEEKLLKLWEGLGYYSRVRNMQVAAQMIMTEHNGIVPDDKKSLIKLKGIGEYTAGAILSIAYDKREKAVDGNVLRVFSRLYELVYDAKDKELKKKVEAILDKEMPNKHIGDFNQAIMDIGATICLPNQSPKCEVCPLNTICQAKLSGNEDKIPLKTVKKKKKIEDITVNVIIYKDKVAITKREDKGLLAGLHQFVNGEIQVEAIQSKTLKKSKHQFTHITWQIETVVYEVSNDQDYQFIPINKVLEEYAIPVAFKVALNYLKSISE